MFTGIFQQRARSQKILLFFPQMNLIYHGEMTKTNFKAYHINLGTLDTSSPYFNLWEGLTVLKALYKGIREAYVFLENIDQVPDLDVAKKHVGLQKRIF